jgi:hypothetical protein
MAYLGNVGPPRVPTSILGGPGIMGPQTWKGHRLIAPYIPKTGHGNMVFDSPMELGDTRSVAPGIGNDRMASEVTELRFQYVVQGPSLL